MAWRDSLAPTEVHDLGDDVYMCRLAGPDGTLDGIIEVHLTPQGDECVGACPFNMLRKPNWMCTGEWPNLTLTPSILCPRCNHHGYIRNGRWVSA